MMDGHADAVATIADRVKRFYRGKQAFRIYHGSTNSTRPSPYRRDNVVDISRLSHILEVDRKTQTVLVEPNVPMDRLVEETLRYGLVPPVVMEFPGITVGGGFAGTSGESSSFRYGFFDRTVVWIEMVLANGDIVTATSVDKPDLFYGAAASFGTLGITTLLRLELIEAKNFVALTYHPVDSVAEAVQTIEMATKDPSNDYVDGILFARHRGVICTGRLTDSVDDGLRTQRFSRAHDPWFYLHAKKAVDRSRGPTTEAIPLQDYLFRYDRGCFWVGMYAFRYFGNPFNRVTRWILDSFMRTRVMYHALHESGHAKKYIIQDVAVPYSAAEALVEYVDRVFKFYPLWLCPLRQTGSSPHSAHGLLALKTSAEPREMLLNVGVWGPGPRRRRDFVSANRAFEQKVRDLHGTKWLYAHAYYTEEEFWAIYGRGEYDLLRAKYHATHLPTLYDKVKVDVEAEERALQQSWRLSLLAIFWSIWPLSGMYGAFRATMGGDYLLARRAWWSPKVKDE
ncbi:MAG: hypothetical protein M1826_005784 [Phylliscum demangeonii]|nr:MAG: hypothetical protein M1826_005784 [Phylliscum demangeonii]